MYNISKTFYMYHIDFQHVIKLLKKKTRRKMPEKTDKNALKMPENNSSKKYKKVLLFVNRNN